MKYFLITLFFMSYCAHGMQCSLITAARPAVVTHAASLTRPMAHASRSRSCLDQEEQAQRLLLQTKHELNRCRYWYLQSMKTQNSYRSINDALIVSNQLRVITSIPILSEFVSRIFSLSVSEGFHSIAMVSGMGIFLYDSILMHRVRKQMEEALLAQERARGKNFTQMNG